MVAVLTSVLVLGVGMSVDLARAYAVKNNLQAPSTRPSLAGWRQQSKRDLGDHANADGRHRLR